jgi:hypothetical protein
MRKFIFFLVLHKMAPAWISKEEACTGGRSSLCQCVNSKIHFCRPSLTRIMTI